ncbi:MAG: DNA polymerase III subunit epsilon [Rickettsiales bacterium]|nr:DNA polymerase III subunit epsilon [Rickettsiales bacterium]
MREIALDTETTGFHHKGDDRMVEIGCVEMHTRIRTGKSYHVYLNPQRDMPAQAQKIHGLSAEFLSDKPLFADVADEFLEFLGDSPLVIHNAAFDMGFINAELKRIARPALPMDRAIDTVVMARERFPGSPANLDALCRRFEIDLSVRTLHGALLDAELLADVYLELMGGRQSALLLDADTGEQNAERIAVEFAKRKFPVAEAELQAHEEFLSQIDEPLWKKLA